MPGSLPGSPWPLFCICSGPGPCASEEFSYPPSLPGKFRRFRRLGCGSQTAYAAGPEQLKQRLPLLDYLRRSTIGGAAGHPGGCGAVSAASETQPSFYVNVRKNLFYCHGCRGGDLIRFVELSQGLSFRQASPICSNTFLRLTATPCWKTAVFYQLQLHGIRKRSAISNNAGCPIALIEELGIGYAPGETCGAISRPRLSSRSASRPGPHQPTGRRHLLPALISPPPAGSDRESLRPQHRRGLPHRLLPRSKGGLFAGGRSASSPP